MFKEAPSKVPNCFWGFWDAPSMSPLDHQCGLLLRVFGLLPSFRNSHETLPSPPWSPTFKLSGSSILPIPHFSRRQRRTLPGGASASQRFEDHPSPSETLCNSLFSTTSRSSNLLGWFVQPAGERITWFSGCLAKLATQRTFVGIPSINSFFSKLRV